MSLGDFLRKQLIDVIQWTEDSDGVLAYRYPMRDMEIQYGARLTVRESQMALFVNEGKIADQFGPGLYTLETQTLPLLTNLQHWYTGFESPFKSDLYFFSTRVQTDQRWGTQQPITIRDKDFGMVRLRGFGLYSFHVADPRVFHQKISGTRERYTVADLEGHLRNTIVERVGDAARADVRRSRPRARLVRRREPLAPGRAAEEARRAHRHEHGGQPARLHAVPGRTGDPDRRRQ